MKNRVFNIFIVICGFLLISAIPANAASYFIDASNGNDSNNGTSPDTSWKTIAKVNRSSFYTGDDILFKRGEVWREQLIISSSGTEGNPIGFGAYGDGDNPTITGTENITGTTGDWTQVDLNIWARPLPKETKVIIFNLTHLGEQSEKPKLPFNFYWANKKIYVYSKLNPAIFYQSIEVGQKGSVITVNNQKYITIQGLNIYGGQLETDLVSGPGGGIYIPIYSENIFIKNCNIEKCHGGGIRILGSSNVTVDNCSISDIDSHRSLISGDAITVSWDFNTKTTPKNITITNNTITGFIDRMGIAVLDCDILNISHNTVTAGVTGIDLEPNEESSQGVRNAIVSDNEVNKGIYPRLPLNIGISVSGANSYNINLRNNLINNNDSNPSIGMTIFGGVNKVTAIGNIIKNSRIGIQVGSGAREIYMDSNTITAGRKNHLYGIYLKGGSTNSLQNNLIEGMYEDSVLIDDAATIVEAYNNKFKNYKYGLMIRNVSCNIIFKENLFSSSSVINHFDKPVNAIATFDKNVYCPAGNYYRWNGILYNFGKYQLISGQDSNGKEVKVCIPSPTDLQRQ